MTDQMFDPQNDGYFNAPKAVLKTAAKFVVGFLVGWWLGSVLHFL